ncbi:NosR/NirI family protein [Diaphorobacter caeni]|uniref:NosR/NirI family protein n=1 Tax=Diaphorobacter caeni TaxID=2784387 RepID=UPI00188EAF58|nr:NosR/NirI family protein [Diaphorobacter caeni]MBF5007047.1 regulatory protein NosR [Diaphorobacter caeni]
MLLPRRFFRSLWTLLLLSLWFAAAPAAHAGSGAYEAELPADVQTNKDMCSLLPCKDVFPGATHFSERKGQPPYVEAYDNDTADRKLLGYVMLSTDITDTPAYSGKPVVTLIGMDASGHFVGVKVLKHSEPILLLGIPESALINFNDQYLGKSVAERIEVGPSRPDEGVIGLDAISGATVTVIAQNQVVLMSGAAVARQVGIIAPIVREPARFNTLGQKFSWQQLVDMGAVKRLVVKPEQVGLPRDVTPFIDLWFGDLNQPDIGRSLLGDNGFASLQSRIQPGESAFFIVRTDGPESFKGSGFVRGGIYDRVQVKQGPDSFTFRDLDAFNLYGLEAEGAPRYTESSIFVIRSSSFSAAHPWKLAFLGNRVDRATGHRSFAVFESNYWMPAQLLDGGRPKIDEPDAPWVRVWKTQGWKIGLFAALLVSLTIIYALREKLTRLSTHKNKWPVNAFKYSFWAIGIVFVGFGAMAQPSITQVLTWFHSVLFQWTWTLFLTDPFIFLFWIFIIITVFLFGRGLFCGWICPFGSLSEALYKVARAVGLKRFQFQLPQVWHDRLKWLKYVIFFGLLAVSMYDMTLAEKLAEVEPFKTTFLVGITNRPWPYGLFACTLLGLSLFIERPFCKYLCPLGASLAIPSTFRWFGLKRKQDCNSCKACAVGCGAQAIDAAGRIDHRECLHCLDCMVLYTDVKGCPPLAKERKRREKEGLPLTPIAKNGYFIPIVPEATWQEQISAKAIDGPDPRMPTNAEHVSALNETTGIRHAAMEVLEHINPWSTTGWARHRLLSVLAVPCLIAVIAAWALLAMGQISTTVIILAWFVWSVIEVLLRLTGRRYVKDGAWWLSRYRHANLMDMLAYVAFKNLLIGAALLIALRAVNWTVA